MKILFVDDKPMTHAYFREQMKKDNELKMYDIELAFDLVDAMDILRADKNNEISAVIIDLHLPMPEIPPELKKFHAQHTKEIQRNEGQLLGLYLSEQTEQEKKKPYFYLSAYSTKHCKNWEKDGIQAFDKNISAEDFIAELKKLTLSKNLVSA